MCRQICGIVETTKSDSVEPLNCEVKLSETGNQIMFSNLKRLLYDIFITVFFFFIFQAHLDRS